MKIFIVLCVAAVASATPYVSEESAEFFHEGLPASQDSPGFDSQSTEVSSELALASGDWKQAATDRTNELRRQGGQKPLTLDSTLSSEAQDWAEKIKCSGGVHAQLVPNTAENLAGLLKGKSDSDLAVDGVDRWYAEVKDYDCRTFTYSGDQSYYHKIGHYFNMMSKQFNSVGFGMAMCPNNGRGWLVARYAGPNGFAQKVFSDELKAQGLGFSNYMNIDKAAFVNCPNA